MMWICDGCNKRGTRSELDNWGPHLDFCKPCSNRMRQERSAKWRWGDWPEMGMRLASPMEYIARMRTTSWWTFPEAELTAHADCVLYELLPKKEPWRLINHEAIHYAIEKRIGTQASFQYDNVYWELEKDGYPT